MPYVVRPCLHRAVGHDVVRADRLSGPAVHVLPCGMPLTAMPKGAAEHTAHHLNSPRRGPGPDPVFR